MEKIKYKKDEADLKFFKELKTAVNDYFKENDIKKTGDWKSFFKALFFISSYIFIAIAIFFVTELSSLHLCYAALGSLSIFTALNVAHDTAHGTLSSNKKLNQIFLYTFDLLGASGYLWKLKHVHSHHPHVNIPDMDGDIKQSNLVRIFPNAPYFNFHRFQFLYMPVLYLLYTLNWLLFRDFRDLKETNISGKPNHKHHRKDILKFFLFKSLFISRMLWLPILFLDFTVFEIISGFLIFHLAAGFTVSLALVSAHIGEHSIYPEPDENGNMPLSWVRHQITTTCDFATDSFLVTHLFGGFNHHVVHHLFPNICHIHYPAITKILVAHCESNGMPYRSNPTLLSAILSHLKFLKIRSRQNIKVDYIEM